MGRSAEPSDRLDPTTQFLCELLSGRGGPEGAAAPVDEAGWAALAAAAHREGVAPLLYHTLQALPLWQTVPPTTRHALRVAYFASLDKSRLLRRELAALLFHPPRSEGSAPSVIVLKGGALGDWLYGDPALRPFGDLDLLALPPTLAVLRASLHARGYRAAHPAMGQGIEALVRYHDRLERAEGQLVVELHWGLVAPEADWRAPSVAWFFEQSEPWPLPDTDPSGATPATRHLTPTAQLLYLAAHLMLQHHATERRLIWFYDLHLLLARVGGRIEWETLLAQARALGWSAALLAALRGTTARFGSAPPEGIMERLAAQAATEGPRSAHLLDLNALPYNNPLLRAWAQLSSLGGAARLRLLRTLLFPTPAYLRWRYRPRPTYLWPLCYPWRWLTLLRAALLAAYNEHQRRT